MAVTRPPPKSYDRKCLTDELRLVVNQEKSRVVTSLETVASAETSTRNAHSARRSGTSGDPPRSQSQGLLAHAQDHCQRRGAEQCVACRTRTAQHEDSLGTACSTSRNRLVRTRMLGGVGRVTSDGGPYPIIRQFRASFDQTTVFDQTLRVVPRRCTERRFRR